MTTDILTHDRPASSSSIASADLPVLVGVASQVLLFGLESMLAPMAGLRLAGTARTLDGLIDLCCGRASGVALFDPFLGRHPIGETLDTLRVAAPALRIVLITDELPAHLVRESVRQGVAGILSSSADAIELRRALTNVAAGRRHFGPAVASRLAESIAHEALTDREMQVLARLSRGDCSKIIARDLDVTVGTVKTHVRGIMGKLGSRSRTDAVLKAFRYGLVGLDH